MTDRGPSVLIVDDVSVNRAILARLFQDRGFEITEAPAGRRALELIARQRFDVVLLDVIMPDLNGLEVLKCIRQHHSAIALPVIMVTSKFEGADVAEALAAGANDYVTKPIDFVVVLARTNTQLALKRANESLEEANKKISNATLQSARPNSLRPMNN